MNQMNKHQSVVQCIISLRTSILRMFLNFQWGDEGPQPPSSGSPSGFPNESP